MDPVSGKWIEIPSTSSGTSSTGKIVNKPSTIRKKGRDLTRHGIQTIQNKSYGYDKENRGIYQYEEKKYVLDIDSNGDGKKDQLLSAVEGRFREHRYPAELEIPLSLQHRFGSFQWIKSIIIENAGSGGNPNRNIDQGGISVRAFPNNYDYDPFCEKPFKRLMGAEVYVGDFISGDNSAAEQIAICSKGACRVFEWREEKEILPKQEKVGPLPCPGKKKKGELTCFETIVTDDDPEVSSFETRQVYNAFNGSIRETFEKFPNRIVQFGQYNQNQKMSFSDIAKMPILSVVEMTCPYFSPHRKYNYHIGHKKDQMGLLPNLDPKVTPSEAESVLQDAETRSIFWRNFLFGEECTFQFGKFNSNANMTYSQLEALASKKP